MGGGRDLPLLKERLTVARFSRTVEENKLPRLKPGLEKFRKHAVLCRTARLFWVQIKVYKPITTFLRDSDTFFDSLQLTSMSYMAKNAQEGGGRGIDSLTG